MANATKTVKSSGGDYTSLNAALAGQAANLTTNCAGTGGAGILTIECYAMQDTTAASTGTGYTTSADYYINIIVPTAERHVGVWNTDKYYLEAGKTWDGLLSINEDYVSVTGLQINNSGARGSGSCAIQVNTASATSTRTNISSCILKLSGTGTRGDGNNGIWIVNDITFAAWNNIIYDAYHGINFPYQDISVIARIDNNTVYGCTVGIYCGGGEGTFFLRNNLCNGNGTDYTLYDCSTQTILTNISEDTTSPNNDLDQKAVTFVDEGNDNFHLGSTDTNAIGAGTDLSATFTIDIDGDTRSSWDIGADEYVAAGGAEVTLTMYNGIQKNVGGTFDLGLQASVVVANSSNANAGDAIGSPPLQTSLATANSIHLNIGNAIADIPLQATVATADGIQKNVGDAVNLTSEFLLSLFDGIQKNVCDVANITVEFTLPTADGIQKNETALITLVVESEGGTEYVLTMYDGAQVQVGEALNLSLETPLPTADGVQQNIADAVELAAEYIMSVLGSYHVNAGDAIGDLPIQITVTASDGTQVNVADAFDVAGKITVSLANGIQITTDDMSAITIEALLNTFDAIQKNVGGAITLTVSTAGDIIARILRVVSKTPVRQIASRTPVRTITSKTATKSIKLIVD